MASSEVAQNSGINSALLASMNEHSSNPGKTSSSVGSPGGGIDATMKTPEIAGGLKTSISLGEFGGMDSLTKGIGGALESNLFEQVGDGTLMSPGKINAFEGMGTFNGAGEISLQKATNVAENFSAGHSLPGLSSGGQQNQQ
jgi:hypothetical protein